MLAPTAWPPPAAFTVSLRRHSSCGFHLDAATAVTRAAVALSVDCRLWTLLVVPCISNACCVHLHCRVGGSQLHCRVHRSCIGMHGCMAFAFVCRKLGPRGTSRKNKSGLLPEFQRTRRVPSLSRHWRDVCQCVRACCSAHVCHAHVRTAGLESGGDYLFKISAASGVVGRRSSCVSGGVGSGRWRGRHGARRQGHPSLSLLAHSLLPPCMTTVLRVLACRSGRVAQVPFSSACFWRGLHFRRAM